MFSLETADYRWRPPPPNFLLETPRYSYFIGYPQIFIEDLIWVSNEILGDPNENSRVLNEDMWVSNKIWGLQ